MFRIVTLILLLSHLILVELTSQSLLQLFAQVVALLLSQNLHLVGIQCKFLNEDGSLVLNLAEHFVAELLPLFVVFDHLLLQVHFLLVYEFLLFSDLK